MPGGSLAQRPNWPQVITEGGFVTTSPVQPAGTLILGDVTNGKLGTGTLGGDVTWSDLSVWVRSGSVTRPATRQQGPLWSYQQGTASVTLNNADGRFDPDNLAGPYVAAGATELNAMVPVRVRAMWNGVTYPLFWGFADAWTDNGVNYAGRYAETVLSATDAQKVLNGITLPAAGAVGAGETSGARITRILGAAMWYTGSAYRSVATGDSTVQAYAGGDTAWNLMQVTADSEIGELYVSGSGQLVFRNRHAILTDTRSNTPQAVFGDAPGTAEAAGTEVPYYQVPRARDDTTLANDIQATRVGGTLQEVQDAASVATYLFPRSYARTDLILQNDSDALNWAQWVLYVSKQNEDRFDQLVIYPLRDPANLWPQVLGREIGDRIQVWRRPPGVATPVTKDVFIRGIAHQWDWSAGTWQTTFTLQDASKYGSFLTLGNATLGKLGSNALAFLRRGNPCLFPSTSTARYSTPPTATTTSCRSPRSSRPTRQSPPRRCW